MKITNIKNNKLIYTIFILFFILKPFLFVKAQTVVRTYNWEIGLPGFDPSGVADFGSFLMIVIRWAYWLAVLFAFIKLLEFGFKYMTAQGNVSVVSYATKSLKNVFLGLLILFGSYIILNTINPELTLIPSSPRFSAKDHQHQDKAWDHNYVCQIQIDEAQKKAKSKSLWLARFAQAPFYLLGGPVGILASEWISRRVSEWSEGYVGRDMRGDPTETSLSQAAKKDIDNGIASASIKNLYNYLSSDSIKNFLASKDCYPGLEVGPIKTGHASNLSTYDSGYRCPNTLPAIRSCHQYGKALDISAFEKKDNSESIRCMEEVKALINKDLPGQFKVQGPEGKNPPHLHVEDIDCAGNICSYPRP